MTDITTTPAAAPPGRAELDLGHPVRSFVLVLVAIGLVLHAVQWSGAVNPRLNAISGVTEAEGDREYATVLLRNDSLVALRIESIEWRARGWTDVRIGVLPPDTTLTEGLRPSATAVGSATPAPVTISGGFDEARWIVLSGRPPCPGQQMIDDVELRVRTWTGIQRTVVVAGPQPGVTKTVCP